jgi:Xaa-Pro dipeptidase
MVVSVEAYIGASGGREGVKLEEQVLVTDDGFEVFSSAPYEEQLL